MLLLATAFLALSACGKAAPVQTTGSTQSLQGQDQTGTTSDLTSFCGEVTATADRPEAYVGSAEHLADVAHMLSVAPPQVRPQMEAYDAYLRSGAVDPTKPDSQLTTNWPPAIQTAVAEIKSYAASNC